MKTIIFKATALMVFLVALAAGCKDPKEKPNEEETFTVIFNSNGGSEVTAQTVKANGKATEPVPVPALEGYFFAGWYTDNQTFSNLWNFAENVVTSDITLYAKWDEIVECDKSKFKRWNGDPGIPISMYADATMMIERIWDGDISNFWRSADPAVTPYNGVIPPMGLTFDLGKTYTLIHFRIWHSAGASWAFAYHAPKIIRIYGNL